MAEWIGIEKRARRCYGFNEISLVPGKQTRNPNEVDISFKFAGLNFRVPILAAAMDGVADVRFAVEMSRLGGLAILNLDGIQTRYSHPGKVFIEIAKASPQKATRLIQSIYAKPIKENLIAKRVSEIKKKKAIAAVSCIPLHAKRFNAIAAGAGADIFVVQATVTSAHHISREYKSLDLFKFTKQSKIPVIIGNCVTYDTSLELMKTGTAGLLIGIGPGAACTTRQVLGIGVPQISATIDTAAARDFYYKKTGRYISIITDGGMTCSGEICKAFACGADAVMVGSAFARTKEAPGKGYHWGMATSHENLPRGTRIYVGITGTLKEILFGPARVDDGSQNLMGALSTSMGSLGIKNINEMHDVEIIIAPSVETEGKIFQAAQRQQQQVNR